MSVIDVESEIRDITRQIVEKYHPEKIILFGSAARGEFTPDSDVDLVVIKKDVPRYGIERMRELRRLVKKKVAADFLVYRPEEIAERLKMGDPFVKAVLSEGKVLYG
jgi:predicted nucleotidyltransferase